MSLLYMSITIHSTDGLYLFLNETNYIVWLFQIYYCCCFAVAKSYPTLQRLGLPHSRLPCPSLSPWVCSNSSIESVMPSNHLILCHPLLLLPLIFPSIRVLSNESTLCIRWPKYWSFSFSISSSNEYSGLIDWFDLLAVQGTLKSLLQHHSSKASVLWCSVFLQSNCHIHTWLLEKP